MNNNSFDETLTHSPLHGAVNDLSKPLWHFVAGGAALLGGAVGITAGIQQSLIALSILSYSGADLDKADYFELTATHHAVLSEHVQQVPQSPTFSIDNIPAQIAKAFEVDEESLSDVHRAVIDGDINKLKQLIAEGHDVNQVDKYGRTALHYAAAFAGVDAIPILAQAGADMNIQDGNGRTAAYIATYTGDKNSIIALAKENADFTIKKYEGFNRIPGNSPLGLAIRNGDFETATLLLDETNADMNGRNEYGKYSIGHIAAMQEDPRFFRLIGDRGAHLNMTSRQLIKYQHKPSHIVTRYRGMEHLMVLKDRGINFNEKTGRGHNMMHQLLVRHKHGKFKPGDPETLEMMQFVIDNGLNINERYRGIDIIQFAIENTKDEKTVNLLLDNNTHVRGSAIRAAEKYNISDELRNKMFRIYRQQNSRVDNNIKVEEAFSQNSNYSLNNEKGDDYSPA